MVFEPGVGWIDPPAAPAGNDFFVKADSKIAKTVDRIIATATASVVDAAHISRSAHSKDRKPAIKANGVFPSELVRLTKTGGPLTKQIRLDEFGKLRSDGSACLMSHGIADRVPVACVGDLGALIGSLKSTQAVALGTLRHGLPLKVEIVTKRSLGAAIRPNVISRTAGNIAFRPGQPGFGLLDFDTKGMPGDVAERLHQAGGFWPALLIVMPGLGAIARVTRASTSAGLYRQDTGAQVPGSDGVHVYLAVRDAEDSGRFLKTLHNRCWLAGFGWLMVGAGGQLLERSIVDRMVGAPERLVFEGAPILVEPLAQSAEARRPDVVEGYWLDTTVACPPLTVLEKARLSELHSKSAHRLAGDSAKARDEFIERRAGELAKRSGVSRRVATMTIRQQCAGVLLPSVVLPFDDPELAGKTVADVLAEPATFEGETLADPLEGVDYGRCKAMIMRRADGTPWINSFAHGRTTYELKLDAAAIRAALAKADAADIVAVLVELLSQAAVEPADEEALLAYARERAGVGLRAIQRQIKKARAAGAAEQKKEAHERRMAERADPRPSLPVPAPDAPWLPVMNTCNAVVEASRARVPAARSIGNDVALARRVKIANLHAFSRATIDQESES
jgi:hypothetical protein